MRVASYNLWFDAYKKLERLESLICGVANSSPDVICFQEVTPEVYVQLKSSLAEYNYWYPEGMTKTYGCITCSKIPFEKTFVCDFSPDTHMARDLIITIVKDKDRTVCIANCHFESEFKKVNQNKLTQFERAESLLNKLSLQTDTVVLCADTNICNDNEDRSFFSSWTDCWKSKGDDANRYTYDYTTNSNLRSRNIKYRSRIDRIVVKGGAEISEFGLIDNVEGLVEPSDHHGIYTDLTFSESESSDNSVDEDI